MATVATVAIVVNAASVDIVVMFESVICDHMLQIGHLYFNARVGAENDSYAGFMIRSRGGLNWGSAMSLVPGSEVIDSSMYQMMRNRWHKLQPKE